MDVCRDYAGFAVLVVVVVVAVHTLYRPKAQSGEDKLRGSQPTLDLDVQSLENHIKNAAASQIARFPRIQHALRPNGPQPLVYSLSA